MSRFRTPELPELNVAVMVVPVPVIDIDPETVVMEFSPPVILMLYPEMLFATIPEQVKRKR